MKGIYETLSNFYTNIIKEEEKNVPCMKCGYYYFTKCSGHICTQHNFKNMVCANLEQSPFIKEFYCAEKKDRVLFG